MDPLEFIILLIEVVLCIDWQVGTGEGDGIRALIAFYPTDASSSNGMRKTTLLWNFCSDYSLMVSWILLLLLASVSIAITGLGADFTRLESFGKVGEFAETLVGFFTL